MIWGHRRCPALHALDRIPGLDSTHSPIEVICMAAQPEPALLPGLALRKTSTDHKHLSEGHPEIDGSREPRERSRDSWAWCADLLIRLTGRVRKDDTTGRGSVA